MPSYIWFLFFPLEPRRRLLRTMYPAVVIVLLPVLAAAYGQIAYQEPAVVSLDDVGDPSTWVSDLFYQGLANFSVRNVGSTACRRQTEMYERNLRNYTSWAVRSELTPRTTNIY